jgi:3-phenylpropionate/trans-cinnamate dioxygenase ferredoxin reductase component
MTVSSETRAMVIVGAGHVGGRTAQALREFGWQGRIVMIGMEAHLPYERPPLSKQLLTGEREASHCQLQTQDAWQNERIEHIVANVERIVPDAREVVLADGQTIAYEALLLATGGHVRRLTIPGADLDSVLTLRTLDDAARIAQRLAPGARVAIIGGGFIGLEVAASARARGCDVQVIEGATRLLGRAVPAGIASKVMALHERNGVSVRVDARPVSIERLRRGVLDMALADGSNLLADTVLVGIGIEPADELARHAGLEVNRGVIVNADLEASAQGIFAAGDMAIFPSRFSGQAIRQETWHNAETQARVAARNMLGHHVRYDATPWFWSDQFDHQLQVAGEPALGTHAVTRTLGDDGSIDFHFDAKGRLIGASAFGTASGIAKDAKIARMLIEHDISPEAALLADPGTKLKSLLQTR